MNKLVPILIVLLASSVFFISYKARRDARAACVPAKVLLVGTNAEYAPFSFHRQNEIVGFDIDLIKEIARRLEKTVELKDMPFDALIPALQTGAIQVIAAGITPTQERAKRILFTKPYIRGDQLIIISKPSNPFSTVDSLKGKSVGVNEGFTADYYISTIGGIEPIRFATALELLMALESGQIEAFVAAKSSVASALEKRGSGNFSISAIPAMTDEYALAVAKQCPELLQEIQMVLDTMLDEGIIEQLKQKWGL